MTGMQQWTASFRAWAKKEAVLLIAAVCAVVSMFFVPPSLAYVSYIDLKVLCMLFCLMLVVAGLRDCGLFLVFAQRLLAGERENRLISLILILLPFFSSMLITNDVALLTFVPFTVFVLEMTGRQHQMIPLIVLQTIGANLGSMATPVGNPQNLFLYGRYNFTPGDFFSVVLPITALSFVLLCAAAMLTKKERLQVTFAKKEKVREKKKMVWYLVLFALCLLSVFRVIPYWAVTPVVAVAFLFLNKKLFAQVDYCLLLTFVCFFIFAGNMGEIQPIQQFLSAVMEKSAMVVSLLTSQVISNVPAAVLLAGFTEDGKGLLLGTNIGGLGTPIASLASLISLKLYAGTKGAKTGKFLLWFTAANVFFLLVLVLFAVFVLY